jgi:hypothetical protein
MQLDYSNILPLSYVGGGDDCIGFHIGVELRDEVQSNYTMDLEIKILIQ